MQPPDPVVFVFGATGYVGAATVLAAARVEHVASVIAHVRPGSARAEATIERFRGAAPTVEIDRAPLDPEAMGETLARIAPTHVFLCHGTTATRGRSEGLDDPYESIDVGLTRLVVDAASTLDPPPRVVYLSSVGTSARARGAYLRARWRAEEVVRNSRLPYTICRAPLVNGPDRPETRRSEIALRKILDPLLVAAGALGCTGLRDRYRSMNAGETAEGLVRSGFHYMTINRVVESDELRRVGVYERESWVPASRRDTPRF